MAMQPFREGENLHDRGPDAWNELLNDVAQARADAAFAKANASLPQPGPFGERIVIVVEAPVIITNEADPRYQLDNEGQPSGQYPYIKVQQVEFATIPPRPCDAGGCEIVRMGDPFEAYPDFGMTVEDFEDSVVDAGDALTSSTHFYRVGDYRGAPVVRRRAVEGGGATKLCRVLDAGESQHTLMAQPVKVTVNEAGQWVLDNDGFLLEVMCWPPLTHQAYERMYRAAVPPVTRLEEHDGVWYARQLFPWRMARPSGRVAGSCTI